MYTCTKPLYVRTVPVPYTYSYTYVFANTSKEAKSLPISSEWKLFLVCTTDEKYVHCFLHVKRNLGDSWAPLFRNPSFGMASPKKIVDARGTVEKNSVLIRRKSFLCRINIRRQIRPGVDPSYKNKNFGSCNSSPMPSSTRGRETNFYGRRL